MRQILLLVCLLFLLVMAFLGFHPSAGSNTPRHSDKLLHFVGFAMTSSVFYFIWEVQDEDLQYIWHWRHFSTVLTGLLFFRGSCFQLLLLHFKTDVHSHSQQRLPFSQSSYKHFYHTRPFSGGTLSPTY